MKKFVRVMQKDPRSKHLDMYFGVVLKDFKDRVEGVFIDMDEEDDPIAYDFFYKKDFTITPWSKEDILRMFQRRAVRKTQNMIDARIAFRMRCIALEDSKENFLKVFNKKELGEIEEFDSLLDGFEVTPSEGR